MKPMLMGFLAIVVIGVASWFVLNQAGYSSAQTFSGPNVRLD